MVRKAVDGTLVGQGSWLSPLIQRRAHQRDLNVFGGTTPWALAWDRTRETLGIAVETHAVERHIVW